MKRPEGTQPTITCGLIGAGRIGKLHAENLQHHVRNAELVAVVDVIEQAAVETARVYGIPKAVADYHEILNDDSLDAVLICSATNTHAQLIRDAAQAGKHIFCEKPIALELHEIESALEAVKKSGVKLQIGFNRRFDANFAKIAAVIRDGGIGEPHILRITSRDPQPPPLDYLRVSGGIFLDMTIHDFDMARFLVGSEVEEVYATGNVLIDPAFKEVNDLDTALITLKFENGALGTIDNSRRAVYGYDQRVEVFGSKGAVAVSNNLPDSHVLMTADGISSSKPLYFFLERYKDSFIAELQAFVDAVRQDQETRVTGKDGLEPVKIGLAAKKSFAEKRPVKLNEVRG